MNILHKTENLIRPNLSESTVQEKENYMPGSQTAENISTWVCAIFKQQKPLQVHFLWSLHMAYCPAGKKCEECFGKRRASARCLRAGVEESQYGGEMCNFSPCPVTPKQTRLEKSSPYIPAGSLPGSHPCLFCTAESIWCMAWTIRFGLWTLGILFLFDTWLGMKDDEKEWKAVYSTVYCTSPLGDILVNPHKCHSIVQPCFLRHLPNPLISSLNQQRIVKTVVWGLFVP